jgi:O-acetylserine/cysteine efflux transporter
MHPSLSLRHFLLGLGVVAVWGTNFAVIKLALAQMPPLLFATLRFVAVILPAIFLVARPAVPWRNLASYGLLIGVGQFGLMFIAMNGHISPGLASLVVQTQVFFTIGLAMWLSGERAHPVQGVSLALAAGGIGVIARLHHHAQQRLGAAGTDGEHCGGRCCTRQRAPAQPRWVSTMFARHG